MEIKIVLKSGKEFRITDTDLAREVWRVFTNPEIPDDFIIKGKNRHLTKQEIEGVYRVVNKDGYWKVRLAYNNDTENVVITQDELLKANFAFATGSNLILKQGSFRGKDIISILPDYSMSMGWNRGYEPTEAEWNEINQDENIRKIREITNNAKTACLDVKNMQEATLKFEQLNNKLLLN